MLQDVAGAGTPESYFHQPSLESWLTRYGLDAVQFAHPRLALRAVIDAASRAGRGAGWKFGLRLQRQSFGFFVEQLRVLKPTLQTDKARIEATFGRTLFIHLTRLDKVDQAVSVVKAQQSGLWHKAPDGTEIERLRAPQKLVYDAGALKAEFEEFVQADADWCSWFDAENIQPLVISYEALSSDPYKELARVLRALGLDYSPTDQTALPVAKLSDAINRDWAARFRAQ